MTRREQNTLLIICLSIPILALFDLQTIKEWEIYLLLFYVAPLGFYIAADPERRKE